jgi:hypothetical protein
MHAGIFTGIVQKHSLGKSNGEKQTPFILLNFKLKGTEEFINAWLYLTSNEKNLRIVRKSLKAVGFDPDKQEVADLQTNPTLLAGNECELELAEEVYNNQVSIKVKWINLPRKPLDELETAGLTDSLRSVKGKDDVDEDIPF